MAQRSILTALCVTALFLPGISCITVTNDPGDGGDGGNGPGPNTVTIRMINATPNRALDVQIYATNQAVNNLDTEFFIAANQQLAGIGFAGSGILAPGTDDVISIPCENALIVGTLGGRFLNEDTGEQVGTGTRYVLFQGSQYACGSTITFTYTLAGAGFTTGLSITSPGQ